MSDTFEIMLDDLTPEAQNKLIEFMGYESLSEMINETNWDTFSLAEVYKPDNSEE